MINPDRKRVSLTDEQLEITRKAVQVMLDSPERRTAKNVDKLLIDIGLMAYQNGVNDTREEVANYSSDSFPTLPPAAMELKLPRPAVQLSHIPFTPRYYASVQMDLHAMAAVRMLVLKLAEHATPVEELVQLAREGNTDKALELTADLLGIGLCKVCRAGRPGDCMCTRAAT